MSIYGNMGWKIKNIFPLLNSFRHKELFPEDGVPPWHSLQNIGETIREFIAGAGGDTASDQIPEEVSIQTVKDDKGKVQEKMLVVLGALRLKTPLVIKDLAIYIGKGTTLEPTAIIKSPAVIGDRCEIRQGAYLRGNVIVGDGSTVGHTTEIKNSVLMNHSEAGHFAYIGDSIIGNYVNMGAGTKLANLQFRTGEEKEGKRKTADIRIRFGTETIETGLRKLGAVIGDYSELGCNSVTSPGVVLEQSCWVYPNALVKKGIYPSHKRIGGKM